MRWPHTVRLQRPAIISRTAWCRCICQCNCTTLSEHAMHYLHVHACMHAQTVLASPGMLCAGAHTKLMLTHLRQQKQQNT